MKEVEDSKNKILKKYSIKLRSDPLTGQQLIVRARNKEKADRKINSFTEEINKALYRKYSVKDLSCGYIVHLNLKINSNGFIFYQLNNKAKHDFLHLKETTEQLEKDYQPQKG